MHTTIPEKAASTTEVGTTSPLVTVQTLATRHPDACPVGGTRHILFHAGDELEATGIVIRLGRKILIDEPRYIDWLRSGGARNIRSKVQQRASRQRAKGAA
jgi:hypothetical protein